MSEPTDTTAAVQPTGAPVEGTVVDTPTTVTTSDTPEAKEDVPPRPGDDGGSATVQTVKIHHDDLNADAEIPVKSLELWQDAGWVEVGESETNAEQPSTGAVEEPDDAGDDTSE